MKIIVCDDDRNFANKIIKETKNIIAKNNDYCDLNIDFEYIYPAKDLMSYAGNNHIDILFLDIKMPNIDGLMVAEKFYELYPNTIIIFVSNFDNYVFYSIRFNPFRFIRKSNLNNELGEAVTSAISKLMMSRKYITIANRSECVQIGITRVLYIEKEKDTNYLNVYCINEEYRYRNNINDLANKLEKYNFLKINSGTIVNIEHIIAIQSDNIFLSNKKNLIIAKKHIPIVKQRYIEFMRKKEGDNNGVIY